MAHSTSSPFHAYDIRGRLGQEFTRETFGEYAAFIAKLFGGERGLCIGRDVRATSEELYASCIEQIRRAVDIPIYNIGVCTTPQLYFSRVQRAESDGVWGRPYRLCEWVAGGGRAHFARGEVACTAHCA